MSNETENREPESSTDMTDNADEAVIAEEEAVIEDADQTEAGNDAPAATLSGDDLSDDEGDDGIVEADDEPAPVILAGRPADAAQLQRIVEGALMAAGKPLAVSDIGELFEPEDRPASDEIRAALAAIAEQSAGRGFELREVASGFRFQVIQEVAPWVGRLWEEKPQRYSRALLETLALIAYRQPITRGDIEDIRGVAVASNIVKTLLERDWVRVVGHKDVPGRPAMYATTRKFLDYFNLKNLDDLPPLAELRDLDSLNAELALEGADTVLEEGATPDSAENNVIAISAHQPAQSDEVSSGDEPAPENTADQPASVTLASLAAGFAERDAEATVASADEQGATEPPEASDFASIVAALRARDQGADTSGQERTASGEDAGVDTADVDTAGMDTADVDTADVDTADVDTADANADVASIDSGAGHEAPQGGDEAVDPVAGGEPAPKRDH